MHVIKEGKGKEDKKDANRKEKRQKEMKSKSTIYKKQTFGSPQVAHGRRLLQGTPTFHARFSTQLYTCPHISFFRYRQKHVLLHIIAKTY